MMTEKLSVMVAFLQHIPRDNSMAKVSITADFSGNCGTLQRAVDTISKNCNPLALRELGLDVDTVGREGDAQLELDEQDGFDITSMLPFRKLKKLSIWIPCSIRLTPDLLELLPTTWPALKTLVLHSALPSNQIPSVNHSHLLDLLKGLPSLDQLTIRFNATEITGNEVFAGALFSLGRLNVCDSPISSPSRVLSFLKTNVSLTHPPEFPPFLGGRMWKTPVHLERWQTVQNSWKTLST